MEQDHGHKVRPGRGVLKIEEEVQFSYLVAGRGNRLRK
jgi:hypothetical protein